MVAGKNLPPCTFLLSFPAMNRVATPAARVKHERERMTPRDYSMRSRPVPLRGSSVAGPTVTNKSTREAFNYYHLPSLVPVHPAVRCLIAGSVCRLICNDDDELDQLLNNVHLNQTWMVHGTISNVNSSLVPLFMTVGPPHRRTV